MGTVTELHARQPASPLTVGEALSAFADELRATRQAGGAPTSETTITAYRSALTVLLDEHRPVAELDTEQDVVEIQTRFRTRWAGAAAATWNARRAALAAFSAYLHRTGQITRDLAAGLERASTPPPRQRDRRRGDIERLLSDKRHALRDRVLWRLLYDTAARCDELLRLNVEDLDLRNRQAPVRRKGGAADRVTWSPSTARSLSRLIAGRSRGPLFLTHRRAKGAARGEVPARDLDPDTERGRISYGAALQAFKTASGGWTFHDLRHSALTHAAEDGVDVTTLMVKSGHLDIKNLARYARPSAERAQQAWEKARGEQ